MTSSDSATEAPTAGATAGATEGAHAGATAGAANAGTVSDAATTNTDAPGAATPLAPELAEFERLATSNAEVPLSMLFSLSLPISIELGRTNMTVQEILRLGRGSVIQLDRLAGQPIDVFVGDRRFAEGEVVVLGEHFGVRVTRIISRSGAIETPEAA
jgi:flagellar motor switch protein FliN/FliY